MSPMFALHPWNFRTSNLAALDFEDQSFLLLNRQHLQFQMSKNSLVEYSQKYLSRDSSPQSPFVPTAYHNRKGIKHFDINIDKNDCCPQRVILLTNSRHDCTRSCAPIKLWVTVHSLNCCNHNVRFVEFLLNMIAHLPKV